jgi:hypothetical protein
MWEMVSFPAYGLETEVGSQARIYESISVIPPASRRDFSPGFSAMGSHESTKEHDN